MNHYALLPDMGGITRHFDFAQELVRRGHEVTIFASSFDLKLKSEKINDNKRFKEEVVNGVRFIWIKTYHYKKNNYGRFINMFSFAFNSYRVGRKLAQKPDTIIGSSAHPFTCISAYYLSKKYKAKYLTEIRDLWPQTLIDLGSISQDGIAAKAFKLLEKFIYNKAEKIVVLMYNAVEYIKTYGVPKDKIIYIPNGVAVNRYDEIIKEYQKIEILRQGKSSSIDNIIKEHNSKFTAAYLGNIGQANSIYTIIEAMKIVKSKGYEDIHILMVGDGVEKAKCIKKSIEYNLDNSIFWYNFIQKQEVPIFLNKIDLCLFNVADYNVLKYGISPNKLFDYLYSGKPVLYACSASNDIVKMANAGISVPAENPEKLAEALIEFYNMPKSKRDGLGENGRDYIRKNHDIAVLADRFESII